MCVCMCMHASASVFICLYVQYLNLQNTHTYKHARMQVRTHRGHFKVIESWTFQGTILIQHSSFTASEWTFHVDSF